jgi:hypothetical protein
MEPANLYLPEALAANWQQTLLRDGFRVWSMEGAYSGEVAANNYRFRIDLRRLESGEYSLDLSQVTDKEVYLRLERIFLAAGARFNLPDFVSSSLYFLYRCDDDLLERCWDLLRAEGINSEVAQVPGFCRDNPDAETFLSGWISRNGDKVPIATGPAFDPEQRTPAYFLELKPEFFLRMRRPLESMIQDTDAVLNHLGAQPIIKSGLPVGW